MLRLVLLGIAIAIWIITGLLYPIRQVPSGAFWMLEIRADGIHNGIYRITPDGKTHQRILPILTFPSSNRLRWSPDGAWIFYVDRVYDGGEKYVLYRMRPDGSDLSAIATNIIWTRFSAIFQFSADNQWAVFNVGQNNSEALYRMRADGTDIQPLTPFHAEQIGNYSWSPDSKWVYYSLIGNTYRVNIELGLIEQVATSSFSFPIWSPSHDLLLFSNRLTALPMYRVRADGKELTLITPQNSSFWPVEWLPNDWVIAMKDAVTPVTEMYRMRPNGSEAMPLYDIVPNSSAGSTADGAWVILFAGHPSNYTMVRIHLETLSSELLLPHQLSVLPTLLWTARRDWLIFSADFEGVTRLYRMRPDGSQRQAVFELTPTQIDMQYQLSPDERAVIVTAVDTTHAQPHFKRWQVGLMNGKVQPLPDGNMPVLSPLFEVTWHPLRLAIIGSLGFLASLVIFSKNAVLL